MRILMLGWEYPPSITGGLGIASQGIAESLAKLGHKVTFLLPKKKKEQKGEKVTVEDASNMKIEPDFWLESSESISEFSDTQLGSQVVTYMPPRVFSKLSKKIKSEKNVKSKDLPEVSAIKLTGKYDDGLLMETGKFALLAVQLASKKKFDLVYCHDWPTFKAGRLIKEMLGLRMAVHVHSIESERNGVFTNPVVIDEESKGIRTADLVFTVSDRTRSRIIDNYKAKKNKITVIPNAGPRLLPKKKTSTKKKPEIAFIGRFTDQKSPGTFIDIARELTSRGLDYDYVMIGGGYLHHDLVEKSKHLNLSDRLKFPGFLNHQEVLEAMGNIDLLIAPSNAEPFGLVMLEAILMEVPVISSPGSGLSEFIPEIPQADRWDIYNCTSLAEKLIEDKKYRSEIIEKCLKKARTLTWEKSGRMISEQLSK